VTGPALDPHAVIASRVGARLHLLGSGSERVVETVARRRRMRPTEVHALVAIATAESCGRPATPGALAQSLRLTTGAITGVVDRLVRSGHVRREADTADRRRIRLACSDPGREVARDLIGTLGAHATAVVAGLSTEELTVVDRFLSDVGLSLGGLLDERSSIVS
jgi:DNA-binding MarR family transcriptional regulator